MSRSERDTLVRRVLVAALWR
ncbi:hypothetical protein Taro_003216 [Colocasia esculenta]|uniref:Uncharacterized protein n=1 Tax=Colocasia esculenta TaxID=4460 RepID=A0A843TJ62_COLES|nr:hypothetical protein [Colocasia esculenta]